MACIYPKDWQSFVQTNGELSLGRFLIEQLDNEWHVFANFRWVRGSSKTGRAFGEIDFLVLSPTGVLHCIECKDNFVFVENGSIWCRYQGGLPKNISTQIRVNSKAIAESLHALKLPFRVQTKSWLFLLHGVVEDSVSMPRENIHDASSKPDPMTSLVKALITYEIGRDLPPSSVENLIPYFSNALSLTPASSSLSNKFTTFMSPVSDVYRAIKSISLIDTNRFVNGEVLPLLIIGVAGSGKTQVGLQLIVSAAQRGETAVIATHTIGMARAIANEFKGAKIDNYKNLWLVQEPYSGKILIGNIASINKKLKFTKSLRDDISVSVVEESHAIEKTEIEKFISHHSTSMAAQIYLLSDYSQYIWRSHVDELDLSSVRFEMRQSYRVPIQVKEFVNHLKLLNTNVETFNLKHGDVVVKSFADRSKCIQEGAKTVLDMIDSGHVDPKNVAVLLPTRQDAESALVKFPGFVTLDDDDFKDHGVIDSVHRFQGFERELVMVIGAPSFDEEKYAKYFYLSATRTTDTFVAFLSNVEFEKLSSILDPNYSLIAQSQ
jgi:hypothetical protein